MSQSVDFKNYNKHRPVDPSDIGFTIPGVKMRWTSGRHREAVSESGMLWVPIRKSQLPKELLEHIQSHYPNAFAEGDTIRRGAGGELVLSYCTTEQSKEHRKYLDQKAFDQKNRARFTADQTKIGRNDYARVTEYEESASAIPRQFLNKTKEE